MEFTTQSPLETILDCYQQWCDENNRELYKLNREDKTLERVTLTELRTLLAHHLPQDIDDHFMDHFMDHFFECWTTHHWTMMKGVPPNNASQPTHAVPEFFDLHEFEEEIRILYRNKPTIETCMGCLEDQPNQFAHMGRGGCLHDSDDDDDDDEFA